MLRLAALHAYVAPLRTPVGMVLHAARVLLRICAVPNLRKQLIQPHVSAAALALDGLRTDSVHGRLVVHVQRASVQRAA
jgi:hypothetical protein